MVGLAAHKDASIGVGGVAFFILRHLHEQARPHLIFPSRRAGKVLSGLVRVPEKQDAAVNLARQIVEHANEHRDLVAAILVAAEQVRAVVEGETARTRCPLRRETRSLGFRPYRVALTSESAKQVARPPGGPR